MLEACVKSMAGFWLGVVLTGSSYLHRSRVTRGQAAHTWVWPSPSVHAARLRAGNIPHARRVIALRKQQRPHV